MYAVITCLRDDHDLRLVLAAAAICIISALTSFHSYHRAVAGQRHPTWLLAPGVVAGVGVWATHFMAMLAYQPMMEIGYRLDLTAASMIVPVAGFTAAFAVARGRTAPVRALAAGLTAGAAITLMHFMGVAAVRMPAQVAFDPVLVTCAGLVVAVLASLAFLLDEGTARRFRAGPALMVAAICGLHFTAMGAIILRPDSSVLLPDNLVGRDALAIATGAAVVLILGAALVIQLVERLVQQATLRALSGALDTAPSALAFFDAQRRLTFWNEPYRGILAQYGVVLHQNITLEAVGQALSRSSAVRSLLDGAPVTEASLKALIARGEFVAPDERVFRLEMGDTPDGGFIIIMHDVTEAARANQALGTALNTAEAASRAKSEFLANMSHEVRTPLNGVLGMAQVMGRHPLNREQRERLSVIQHSGATLLALLDDVLDIAKIEAGALRLEVQDFDLAARLRAACAPFAEAAVAKNIAFRIDIDPALEGPWCGDGARLAQVVGHLASNAVKFTSRGEVKLSAQETAQGVRLTVQDSGVGMSQDKLAGIFEPFAQGDSSSTRAHGGAGLGLSLARQVCELMGGQIEAASAEGQGSTFVISLPLVRGEAQAEPEATATDQPMRILAAEDNPTNQQVLAALMAPLGVELVIADDGLAAVEAFERESFDLILMDIQMPRMSGVEAAQAIRDIEARRGQARTPILAVTANIMTHQIQEYLAVGMDATVPKPINAQALLSAIIAAANGPAAANAA